MLLTSEGRLFTLTVMKKNWGFIIIALIVILVIGGYVARHQLKSMLGMSSTKQTTIQPEVTSSQSSASAPTDNIYRIRTDAVKGKYLTDFQGLTLYTFDKDTKGASNCSGQCLTVWPFYTSGATAESILPTNITVITRSDNTKQFAWKGKPLYYYVQDHTAGDINGDGVDGVWHIVQP